MRPMVRLGIDHANCGVCVHDVSVHPSTMFPCSSLSNHDVTNRAFQPRFDKLGAALEGAALSIAARPG